MCLSFSVLAQLFCIKYGHFVQPTCRRNKRNRIGAAHGRQANGTGMIRASTTQHWRKLMISRLRGDCTASMREAIPNGAHPFSGLMCRRLLPEWDRAQHAEQANETRKLPGNSYYRSHDRRIDVKFRSEGCQQLRSLQMPPLPLGRPDTGSNHSPGPKKATRRRQVEMGPSPLLRRSAFPLVHIPNAYRNTLHVCSSICDRIGNIDTSSIPVDTSLRSLVVEFHVGSLALKRRNPSPRGTQKSTDNWSAEGVQNRCMRSLLSCGDCDYEQDLASIGESRGSRGSRVPRVMAYLENLGNKGVRRCSQSSRTWDRFARQK